MDSATKAFWEKVVHELEHLNRTLDDLLKIVERPRRQHSPIPENKPGTTSEANAASERMQPQLHIEPTPNHQAKTDRKWYQTAQGWKSVLEPVALGFAILYALVTGGIAYINYNQWQDAQENFKADERSWAKIKYEGPKKEAVNATDNARTLLVITNTGKSVITSMYGVARMEILGSDAPPSFADSRNNGHMPPPSSIMTNGPLFPTEPTLFPVDLVDVRGNARPFSLQEVTDLLGGRSYIATWGYLAYRDHFGTHWYKFCSWQAFGEPLPIQNSGVNSGIATPNMAVCVNWNEVGEGEAPPGWKRSPY